MNLAEIEKWAWAHVETPSRFLYLTDRGYKRRFETGETYEYSETWDENYMEKTVKISINGKLVNTVNYIWHNFGWKLVKEEPAA